MKSIVGVLVLIIAALPARAQVNVITSHNNNNRDGQNLNETILTPGNVVVGTFGKLFAHTVDGDVYAQPLYVPQVTIPGLGVHNVVFVVTQHDSVYAFDADTKTGMNSAPLWHRGLIRPARGVTSVSSGDLGCTDIVPEVGITGTPVIDTVSGTMYLVAKTKENGKFFQRLHALDITTGAERPGSPVVIKGKIQGDGDGSQNHVVHFDPFREAQRSGLLLQNGGVYIGWASHCDIGPYHGWVMSYDETTLAQTGVWNSTRNGGLGGVWQAGTGMAADSSFNLFIATGNGTYDGKQGGNDFSDSVIKLALPDGSGHFSVADWFTPYNQGDLSNRDADVGSGGVMLLPDQGDPYPHLLVQVGKSGSIYLISRDRMGHYNLNDNHQIVQDMENAIGGLWSTPAWWNDNVYFGGSGDYLRQYTFDPKKEQLSSGAAFVTPTYFGFPGPSPSISANGTADAIVWALQTDNYGHGSAILHAYDATNVTTELYNTGQDSAHDDPGGSVKFTVPTVAGGKVYVPAAHRLTVYGLLNHK